MTWGAKRSGKSKPTKQNTLIRGDGEIDQAEEHADHTITDVGARSETRQKVNTPTKNSKHARDRWHRIPDRIQKLGRQKNLKGRENGEAQGSKGKTTKGSRAKRPVFNSL